MKPATLKIIVGLLLLIPFGIQAQYVQEKSDVPDYTKTQKRLKVGLNQFGFGGSNERFSGSLVLDGIYEHQLSNSWSAQGGITLGIGGTQGSYTQYYYGLLGEIRFYHLSHTRLKKNQLIQPLTGGYIASGLSATYSFSNPNVQFNSNLYLAKLMYGWQFKVGKNAYLDVNTGIGFSPYSAYNTPLNYRWTMVGGLAFGWGLK